MGGKCQPCTLIHSLMVPSGWYIHDGDGQISRKSEEWCQRGRDAGLAKTTAVHHGHFCFIKGKKNLSVLVCLIQYC